MDLSIDKKIIVKQVKGQQVVYASSYYYMELSVAGMLVNLDIKYSDDSGPNAGGAWDSYEEALEKGLQEAFKYINK